MRAILSRPDVRLLLAGQTLSMFGDWAMLIVLAVWMKVLTGSSSAAGLVFFVFAARRARRRPAAEAAADDRDARRARRCDVPEGVGLVWAVVALATAYQMRSPGPVQGRVAAAANMLFSAPQTISVAVGAVLVTLIDYRLEIAIMTVATLGAATYLLTRRREEAVEAELAAAA